MRSGLLQAVENLPTANVFQIVANQKKIWIVFAYPCNVATGDAAGSDHLVLGTFQFEIQSGVTGTVVIHDGDAGHGVSFVCPVGCL